MASGAIAGGAVSKTKHKRSEISDKRLKPTTEVRPEKISLNSISKLEVRNLKRKLSSELEKVRSLMNRLDTVPSKKLKTANNGGKVQVFKSCNSLLTKLMKHKSGWIFNTPVDAVKSGLHDYHSIVKKPMDLGTVKSRLSKGWYESPLEFAEDVRLTFNNALLYNPVGHDVHRMAEFLLNMFEEKWAPLETQYQSLSSREELTAPPSAVVVEDRTLERAESMTKPVEPLAEKRVEEEEACGDRELTFEEKRRLSEDLQDLPFDKLEEVVQIIKKRNPELTQQDDEIELDIDSLDLETLWELYRFVTGYKESLSKRKEEGLGLERDAESVHNSVQEPNTLITGPESPKVTSLGHVASPVRQVDAGGASSSSSGSGSYSSDSDSGSPGHRS